MWRGLASGGASWSSSNAISKLLGGPQNASCGGTNPVIRSLAAGGVASPAGAAQNAGSPVLYAGMAGVNDGGGSVGGHLFSTIAADTATSATAWTDLAASPVTNDSARFNAGGFDISSVAVDPHDTTGRTIYATVMGFAGNGVNAKHVYRSTDGGASWTNISSNLPSAPANSVVVDPNDANTVYVALDTGVYVTYSVTTCTTENCWNVYGTTLPNAPVVSLMAAPNMPTGDGRTGVLRAATYGRGIWQIPLLNATAPQEPAMSLAPNTLAFGVQAVDSVSAAQTITVTNTGSAALSVSRLARQGDFTETDTCTAAPIAPGMNCSIQVSFRPAATGSRPGLLTVYGNVPGGQATATLSGTGSTGAAIVLDPVSLSFPSTTIHATSAVQNITISNTSSAAISLQTPAVSGADFKLAANTCGPSLASQTGCTVAIAFVPTASGARSGTFNISDDAGIQSASLTGFGAAPPTDALSPLSLTFASQQIDTASAVQQVILTNSGDQPLTLIAAQITSGDFTVVNACGNSLNPHSTCSLNVAFTPKDVGTLAGALTLSDQYRSQTVALNGFGLAPPGVSLAPFSTVNFAATGVGLTSAGQTVTLTNNGGIPLHVQGIAITGDFAIAPGNHCEATVAAGTACTMQVVFTPTAGGPRTGTLTVTDDAPNSPQALTLNGAGVDFTLNSNGPASVTITNGQNAVFPLLLSSAANVSGVVTFACTGFPANSTCNVTPGSIALGNTTTISVTVLTGVSTAASASRPLEGHAHLLWLAMLLPLGLFGTRSIGRCRLASVAVLCVLMTVAGCGAGRTIPAENNASPGSGSGQDTPVGTYTIAASASSAGLTHSVNLTLIVQ